jgi:hypothetical protein
MNILKKLFQPMVNTALEAAKPGLILLINGKIDASGIPVVYTDTLKQSIAVAIMQWRIKL